MNYTGAISSLELGMVKIENDSWICGDSCYHDIIEPNCECDCHNLIKLKLVPTFGQELPTSKRWCSCVKSYPLMKEDDLMVCGNCGRLRK